MPDELIEEAKRYAEQVRGGVVLSTSNLADFIEELVERLERAEEVVEAAQNLHHETIRRTLVEAELYGAAERVGILRERLAALDNQAEGEHG